MKVLITRPERDAADLKSRIEALGASVILAPLLRVEHVPINPAELDGATGIIATSRNALRSLAASPILDTARHLELFAVGAATAAMARDLDFEKIVEGPGTGAGLAAEIIRRPQTASGPLLHLAGDHLAFDMAASLAPHGIAVKVVRAYQTVAAKTLPAEAVSALANNALDAVILMSPLTASTWATLATAVTDASNLARIAHICLSAKVASALPPPLSPAALIANTPQIDEIVTLLYRLAGHTKNR